MKVAVIGDAHGVKLILNVPLKTASRYFILHKIIALPTRISDDINFQYLLDFTYFGLDNIQRNYILFTEADLSHCSKGSITVCSVDKAIYCTQISNVRIEPVFSEDRPLKFAPEKITPTLQNSDPTPTRFVWVYHFPEQQHVTLRWWKNGTWISSTEEFSGGGVLYHASRCCVAASESQTVPDRIGKHTGDC